jgi:hypothetical protein
MLMNINIKMKEDDKTSKFVVHFPKLQLWVLYKICLKFCYLFYRGNLFVNARIYSHRRDIINNNGCHECDLWN